MPGYSGPKIENINNINFIYHPGDDNIFINNASIVNPSDGNKPLSGKLLGIRRTLSNENGIFGNDTELLNPDPESSLIIKNISSSIYELPISSIYTISIWVKIADMPSWYNDITGYSVKSKRTSIVRFEYSQNDITNKRQGFIEFGAMAPYYLDSNNNYVYKSVFEPLSLGVDIGGARTKSICTDYKFNLNKWYNLTLELTSDTNFSKGKQFIVTKFYVNGELEEVTESNGIAWREHQSKSSKLIKRKNGHVISGPGFLTRTGKIAQHTSSRELMFSYFMDLSRLNHISYSPIKIFPSMHNNGGNEATAGGGKSSGKYQNNSNIDFGQLLIYSNKFDKKLYDAFKSSYK